MVGTVLVTGMQKGYVDDRTQSLAADIDTVLEQSDLRPIFARFVNREGSNFVKLLSWEEMQTPEETALVQELKGHSTDANTFTHHTYSALTANGIQQFIRQESETLYLCGIDTDATVLDTALHAFNAGYDIHIIEDLCDSRAGPDAHQGALTILERTVGQIVPSTALQE